MIPDAPPGENILAIPLPINVRLHHVLDVPLVGRKD